MEKTDADKGDALAMPVMIQQIRKHEAKHD